VTAGDDLDHDPSVLDVLDGLVAGMDGEFGLGWPSRS